MSHTVKAYGSHSEYSMGGGKEGTQSTARSGMEEVAVAEKGDTARAREPLERRDDEGTHEISGSYGIAALSFQGLKGRLPTRPSTAPALVEKLVHLSEHDNTGAERGGVQGLTPVSIAREDPATPTPGCDATRPFNGSTSHRSTSSAGGSKRSDNDSEGSSVRRTPREVGERDLPAEPRPYATFTTTTTPAEDAEYLTATTIFDADLDLISPANLRPSTAEAQRRRSIEVDAALSRSSRLPPPSCSLTVGSDDGFTLPTGSMIGEQVSDGKNCERGKGGRDVGGRYLAATEANAGIGPGVDITIITGLAGRRADAETRYRARARSSRAEGGGETKSTMRLRFRRQGGGQSGGQPRRQRRRQRQGQPSSATENGSVPPCFSGSRTSSTAAALGRATGTTWTQWRRPGDLGELDLRADLLHCTNGRGGRRQALGRATNGAVAGVGWGGGDQVRIMLPFSSKAAPSRGQPDSF